MLMRTYPGTGSIKKVGDANISQRLTGVMMNHPKEIANSRARLERLKTGMACLALGMLAACGGGDGDSVPAASSGSGGGSTFAAQTTVVERSDLVVQSANPATTKLADRKCIKRARTEAGDNAARKAMRQSARREACEAEHQAESQG
jgi:hypothetical protein